jgi:hypothetical protein
MSKHTNGPWLVFCKDDRYPGIEAEHKSIVIFGNDGESGQGVRGDTREEALANARLIAAAPELLEASQSLLAIVESEFPDYVCDNDRRVVAARNVIAKVTGEA